METLPDFDERRRILNEAKIILERAQTLCHTLDESQQDLWWPDEEEDRHPSRVEQQIQM